MYITEITERTAFEGCLPLLNQLRAEIGDGGAYDAERAWHNFVMAYGQGYHIFAVYADPYDEQPVGMMGLREFVDPGDDVPGLQMNNLVITKDRRGQGYGAALIKQAESYAGANGYGWISLHVNANNRDALRIYDKNGYTVLDTKLLGKAVGA